MRSSPRAPSNHHVRFALVASTSPPKGTLCPTLTRPVSANSTRSRWRPAAAAQRHGGQPHPTQGSANSQWWPNRLNLKILAKNPDVANPLGEDFDYKAAFAALDLDAVKQDIEAILTDSQDWWPADFGHYGPFMMPDRMAQRRHLPDPGRPRRPRAPGSG